MVYVEIKGDANRLAGEEQSRRDHEYGGEDKRQPHRQPPQEIPTERIAIPGVIQRKILTDIGRAKFGLCLGLRCDHDSRVDRWRKFRYIGQVIIAAEYPGQRSVLDIAAFWRVNYDVRVI